MAALLVLAATAPAAHAAFPADPPNDPLFDASPLPNYRLEQWDLTSDRGISVDRAWKITTGEGVVIADVDVGVQADHPDLAGRWATSGIDVFELDADPSSPTQNAHGTNVAGVLGAAADNGIGIAGIAPGAKIMAVRSSDDILHQGRRLAHAIVHSADNGADVISMSLGADSFSGSLRRALAYAERKGVVIAVASGNEFHFHHHWPQLADTVLAVGGINPDTADAAALQSDLTPFATDFTRRAAYSDYGPHLDVVAPTQVPTTQWGGGYITNWSGTSAATPHVAGAAALVKAANPSLNAAQVRMLIRMTADDLGPEGWDQRFGWGRVNAFAAVDAAKAGRIPPTADLLTPEWYAPQRARFAVRGRVGGEWTLELGRGEEPSSYRVVARGTRQPRRGVLARVDPTRLDAGGWTLRLRVAGASEDRAFFYAVRDPAVARGFPKRLGASGESAPVLADLTGDRVPEIVLATSEGAVHAWNGRTRRRVRGWPQRMRPAIGMRAARARIGTVRPGFLATPAVGNIAGRRGREVVAAGLDGRVYAWDRRGRRLPGFPVAIDIARPPATGKHDAAIYASPALVDLDRDRLLDIVVGAADQKVYAWNGRGKRVNGWPVLARDGESGDESKILSSPAVGDLDGDGSPEVVEGTGEAYGSTPDTSGRVYAWDVNGKLLPGWPVKPTALSAQSIPLAGEGVPSSPVLADVDADGRDEVAVAAFTGQPELYRGDGTRMSGPGAQASHFQTTGTGPGSEATAPSIIALGANAAFGRTEPGGPLGFFSGAVDSRLVQAQLSPAQSVPFEHLVGGWDAQSGEWRAGFPRVMEGWTILAGPAVADVNGDGRNELLAGSSGNVLHAVSPDGTEPAGWPKDTGGWLLAAPAVGDVDGDRRLEVVAVTRDGFLWVWNTPTRASAQEWPSFRHDARNSGRYG